MQIFITGTDTNIGKTIISSWLCLQSDYDYFKPIQTGSKEGIDSDIVRSLSNSFIHTEAYIYKEPLSPHLAAQLENDEIQLSNIYLPKAKNLIIEGAGGVYVPLNQKDLMIDLIAQFKIPIILVARSSLGTINHTLLTIQALRLNHIEILGVILNGPFNQANLKAIEFYGKVKILASMPPLDEISKKSLKEVKLSNSLKEIFL